MFDPELGRWNSVDPLANKYMPYSPFSYAVNNPLFFKDPDGRRVVDKNGNEVGVKISTDENGVKTAQFSFAENTSKKVKRNFMRNGGRAINSAINSARGEELVKAAVKSNDNIHISLSGKAPMDRMGATSNTNTHTDVEGNITRDIEVVIYTGSIDMVSSGKDASGNELIFGGTTKKTAEEWEQNSLSRDQKIGGVSGHELYHATNDMGKGRLTVTQHQEAYDAESVIIKEFGTKNKNKKK